MTTIEAVKLDAKRVLEMRRAFDEIEREYDARRNKLAEEIEKLSRTRNADRLERHCYDFLL